MSETSHDLSRISQQELAALDQNLLAEQVHWTLNNLDAIVVEADAPESTHEQVLKAILRRKGIEL